MSKGKAMKNPPDERLVYLALQNVFRGPDAQLRRSKRIRDLIQKRQTSIDVRDLIEAHNIDNVCNVTKLLLEQGVFESTLKAKIRFPEVFEVSPAQSAERAASEAEAARTEADKIQVAAESSSPPVPTVDEDSGAAGKAVEHTVVRRQSTAEAGKKKTQNASFGAPSLYPVYLPYQTQHKLLVNVQQALERAFYSFAMQSLPEVVEQEEWECAESVELNLWARKFAARKGLFPQKDVDQLGKPVKNVFDSIAQLRHTAVHRVPVSATRLETFLSDAESIATLLHDDCCNQQLSRLRRETSMTIEDIKRNKDLLESQLVLKKKKIAAQRAELDRLEQLAVTDLHKEDRQYRQFAGLTLDQAIDSPDTVRPSIAATERDIESDGELSGCQSNFMDASSCQEDGDDGQNQDDDWTSNA